MVSFLCVLFCCLRCSVVVDAFETKLVDTIFLFKQNLSVSFFICLIILLSRSFIMLIQFFLIFVHILFHFSCGVCWFDWLDWSSILFLSLFFFIFLIPPFLLYIFTFILYISIIKIIFDSTLLYFFFFFFLLLIILLYLRCFYWHNQSR